MENKSVYEEDNYRSGSLSQNRSDDHTLMTSYYKTPTKRFILFYSVLFLIIFITTLIYFNAPSRELNFIIESYQGKKINEYNLNFPFYKVISRYSKNNGTISNKTFRNFY